ncbi:MAG: carboxypeptidase regulatory-like domain-containing protein [Vicinamibacterales bacterium]
MTVDSLGRRAVSVIFLVALLACASLALAQGGTTTSVSGTVVDTSGAVVPGADVVIKNLATSATYTAVTAENGTFSVPGINPGTYSVTVTLMGFKTHVVPELPVAAGVPAAVRCVLEVGQLEETVVVEGGTEIVQTAASAVATTLNVRQITNLPLSTRDMTNFVGTMPGVDVASTTRDANVNGLPQGQINITIDGVNVQDNTLKTSDGFFAIVSPRLDAMEEMTFSSAAQGADAASQGAVQMRFTTRSGGNRFVGSAYYYFQHDKLNTNTWFNIRDNIPKANLNLKQPGGRLGGPIKRDRAFFFFNYEEYLRPSARTTNATILHPRAEQGWFRYLASDGSVREINVLDEARALGLTDTIDPLVGKLLADIRASTAKGTVTDLADPRHQRLTFAQPTDAHNRYPTVRFDFNLTQNHRLSASSNYSTNSTFPDTTNGYWAYYPDFPVILGQSSNRYQYQVSVRSVFGKSLVNEARYGGSGSDIVFYKEYEIGMLTGSVANQGGFTLGLSAAGITNAGGVPTPQARNAPVKTFEDTLTWLRGKHSLAFGGSFTQFDYWGWMDTLAPSISFGLVQGDPALGTIFSGKLSGSNLTNAQNLYAVLTGRVSQIGGNVRLNENTLEYEYLGKGMSRARLRQMDFFAQDSWRLRPNMTLNFGARYSLQLPFTSLNSSYSYATMEDVFGITGVGPDFKPGSLKTHLGYLFQPGVLKGKPQGPEFHELKKGVRTFDTDLDNIAPSVGFNWTPNVQEGFLKRLIGNPGDTSISGGYSVAYQRPGLSDFTGVVGSNPGVSVATNRNVSLGNLADPNGGPGILPVLLRETNRLGPPSFPKTRVYPMKDVITADVAIFDPKLQVPYAQTYTVGIQRAVSKDMSVSVRYVGTRNKDGWTSYNYNETNIIENGFLDEFKKAQKNLQANIAAGKGNTFAYTGAPGTSPLPIYLAYFEGKPQSVSGDPASYTSSRWSNSSYYNYLALTNPNPFSAAGTGSNGLQGNQTLRDNAVKAGLPRNFFIINPDLMGGAEITSNGGYTKYNSLQFELRRRLSQGLQFNVNYVFGRSYGSSRYSFRVDRLPTRQTGGGGGVEHALKANWVYELPIGQGQRFMSGAGPLLNRFVAGWQVHGLARIQSGRLLDFGNVRLVGMTPKDLQEMFKVRLDGARMVWMLPQDVIDNTVKAYSWSATDPSGYTRGVPEGRYIAPAQGPSCIESISSSYGDCGMRTLVITGPTFVTMDLSVAKRFEIRGRVNFDFRAEMFNVLNRTNFTPVTGLGSDPSGYEVTSATSGRTVQLVWRINF